VPAAAQTRRGVPAPFHTAIDSPPTRYSLPATRYSLPATRYFALSLGSPMISSDNNDLRLAATSGTCPAQLHEDCLVPLRAGLAQEGRGSSTPSIAGSSI